MALAAKPNGEVALDALLVNLREIGKASGYWLDVKTAMMPDYEPLQDAMMAEEAPALLVWVLGDEPQEGRIGMADRALTVSIYGVLKGVDGAQVQLIRFVASLRKCLLFNRQLALPGSSEPSCREVIEEPEGVEYAVDRGDQSKAAGMFVSRWRIVYGLGPED